MHHDGRLLLTLCLGNLVIYTGQHTYLSYVSSLVYAKEPPMLV